MPLKLDQRLLAVAQLAPEGKIAADIGSDHGYIPLWLAAHDICPRLIATEKSPGPYGRLVAAVEHSPYGGRIETRLGDGLQALRPGEAQVLIMAGMGGRLIIELLEQGAAVLAQSEHLILQPQNHSPLLRRWLEQQSWRIVAEDLVWESGFYYEVIAAEPGQMQLSEAEAQYGPCLLQQAHPLLLRRLSQQLAAAERLDGSLAGQSGPAARRRRAELKKQTELIRSILQAQEQAE